MKMRRKAESRGKSSELPKDFVKMVAEVFTTNFAEGLEIVCATYPKSHFVVAGMVYPDEVMLSISLTHPGQLAATTVHVSSDFDPKASTPNVQDLLGVCVDAAGAVFGELLDPKTPDRIEEVLSRSLGALRDVPFEWTEIAIEKRKVFILVDKSNPTLELAADLWLAKHDPELKEREEQEREETESLFVTGASARKKSGQTH